MPHRLHLVLAFVAAAALHLSVPPGAQADDVATEALASTALEHLGWVGPPSELDRLELVPRLTLHWAAGTRVRYEQRLDGLRVLGREIVVSLASDGSLRSIQGEPLAQRFLSGSIEVSALQAASAAQTFAETWSHGTGQLWTPRAELAVHVARDGTPSRVWLVHTSIAEPLGLFDVLVGAQDGQVRAIRSTLIDALAHIYPTNPEVSDLTEVELLRLSSTNPGMSGEHAYVKSCDNYDKGGFGGGTCTEKSQHATADADGNFLFEPDPTSSDDPLAEVQMYYHLDQVSEWFATQHGFTHQFGIEGLVNFDYNNAAFGDFDGDGQGEVGFGQTTTIDYAYDADVIYHEFGHSVFGRIAGQTGFIDADEYGLLWDTGAINEGQADLFSLVLTGDPVLGEYAGRSLIGGTSAIRDLEEDRHCPTDLYGESHRDGEVFGSFGWNLIEDPLLGADFTGDFIYGSILNFPPDASWQDAGEAMLQTAQEMLEEGVIDQEQFETVTGHMEASGLDFCSRVIRLDEGQEPTLLMVATSFFPDAHIPLGNQFSIDVPETADRVRFRVKKWLSGQPNLGWVLHVRRDEHIVHDLEEINTGFAGTIEMPVPAEYDFLVEGEGEGFELELTPDGDHPLVPGATYYFSMASRHMGSIDGFMANAEVTVDADVWLGEAEAEAEADSARGAAGCACDASALSTVVQGQPRRAAALALLMLFLTRLRWARQRQRTP